MITTPLCTLLGIERPILNASMAGTATGELAAAVSEAGGFGMIGGTNPGGASWLREQIRIARSLTSRPFGVGFISAFPDTEELARVALEEGVAAINHSFADPTPFVAPTHDAGAKLFAQVQTLKQAIRAAEAGVDVIIAQGGEAGGHAGAIGTFALLPAVVDAVAPIPVVAAGGIADGRGLAAALLLGRAGRLDGHPVRDQPRVGRTVLGTAGGPRGDLRRHRPDAPLRPDRGTPLPRRIPGPRAAQRLHRPLERPRVRASPPTAKPCKPRSPPGTSAPTWR